MKDKAKTRVSGGARAGSGLNKTGRKHVVNGVQAHTPTQLRSSQSRDGGGEDVEVNGSPGQVETQRAALVAQKQAQLEGVYDRHDTLVREIFHMENFRMMVGFNPQV
ncbi:hypothetical protein BDN72DRAFT_773068 [Pluteus cervinus]|uniref:Uncharacterized protein n=1 Tax=Pluteus cervinus TaxID=181527 RepID=A0ACD3AIL3_9AGAR|nr:hypothetical protein BDN72DRAFT_773068 [Pluteus cervinus]